MSVRTKLSHANVYVCYVFTFSPLVHAGRCEVMLTPRNHRLEETPDYRVSSPTSSTLAPARCLACLRSAPKHFSHIILWHAGKLSAGLALIDMPNAHPHSDRQSLGSAGYPTATLWVLSVLLITYGKWDPPRLRGALNPLCAFRKGYLKVANFRRGRYAVASLAGPVVVRSLLPR